MDLQMVVMLIVEIVSVKGNPPIVVIVAFASDREIHREVRLRLYRMDWEFVNNLRNIMSVRACI